MRLLNRPPQVVYFPAFEQAEKATEEVLLIYASRRTGQLSGDLAAVIDGMSMLLAAKRSELEDRAADWDDIFQDVA